MTNRTATACGDIRGEALAGPGWDAERGELLWIETSVGVLRRARVRDGAPHGLTGHQVGPELGCAVPASVGGWLLALGAGFAHLEPGGGVRQLGHLEAFAARPRRLSTGGCDPQGRFWAIGAAGGGDACLYRMDLDGTVVAVCSGLRADHGIGWSPDGATMYVCGPAGSGRDAAGGQVTAFDFDGRSGWPTRRRVLVEIDPAEGTPRGLAVDDEGCLWLALFGGWQLHRYHPSGALETTVRLPVAWPTGCAFAGPERDGLYVTSTRRGLDAWRLADQPEAGRMFVVAAGVTGSPCAPFRGTVLRASPV
jgi:sugar lactone lactonase YvrE